MPSVTQRSFMRFAMRKPYFRVSVVRFMGAGRKGCVSRRRSTAERSPASCPLHIGMIARPLRRNSVLIYFTDDRGIAVADIFFAERDDIHGKVEGVPVMRNGRVFLQPIFPEWFIHDGNVNVTPRMWISFGQGTEHIDLHDGDAACGHPPLHAAGDVQSLRARRRVMFHRSMPE